jgi:2-oxoglutarate dehydrogenase E1 component
VKDDKVKRVVFCSGQVYYDLAAARNKDKKNDVAIVRIEQFSPFPFGMIKDELLRFKNAEVVWS